MDSFELYLVDQLARLGSVVVRRMFGGAGLYLDGIMFGLLAEGTCYLKTDDGNRGDYEAQGMGPFVYEARGKQTAMSYHQVPQDVLDSADEFSAWARKSWLIARANKAKAPARTPAKARAKAHTKSSRARP